LLLAAFALASAVLAFRGAARSLAYWLVIYALAYVCVAVMSLTQAAQARRAEATRASVWGFHRSQVRPWDDPVPGQEVD